MRDHGDFVGLYERERDHLYRAVTFVTGDPAVAAEAVDEAFVRAYERWYRVRLCDSPAGWVYRVAVNWATSWHRKWAQRPTRPLEQLDRAGDDALPDVDLMARLQRLPVEQRTVVVLRYLLDRSVSETAAELRLPIGTVKSRLHRALRQLGERPEVLR